VRLGPKKMSRRSIFRAWWVIGGVNAYGGSEAIESALFNGLLTAASPR
jgi:hypothetical protein